MILIELFFYFIVYSFLGWLIECMYCFLGSKKFVNRGFLIGPYCPIYGTAAVAMVYILRVYVDKPFALFVMAALITTTIEYITSYAMEKIFNARWWDYSHRPFNINGRVYLLNSIYFGILGFVLVYFVHPLIGKLFLIMSPVLSTAIVSVIFTAFTIDCFISFNTMYKIKDKLSIKLGDCTEEVNKIVKKLLSKHNFYAKHLFKAFPNPILKNKGLLSAIKDKIQNLNIKKKK